MDLSTQAKEDFARFGCTLEFGTNCFYIDLRDVDKERLSKTKILVRVTYAQWVSTPLFCLAFEVSPNRVLTRYCYFPFNLSNSAEREFLKQISELEELNIILVGAEGERSGKKKLRPWQIRQLQNLCAKGIGDIETRSSYDFTTALKEFETTVRLPQLFERVMSDSEVSRFVQWAKDEAAKVPLEKLNAARQVSQGYVQIWKKHFGNNMTAEQLRLLYTIRLSLLIPVELYREFGDFDQLTNFFADLMAAKVEDATALRSAMQWSPLADAALKLVTQFSEFFEVDKQNVRTDFIEQLAATLGDVAGGRALSLSMLQKVFSTLQPALSARSGRPSKDYSKEFEWKHSMSWTDVARKSLYENPEIREEFGGRGYETLSFEQQESLKGRIREGVKSWAQRNGKQLPGPAEKDSD